MYDHEFMNILSEKAMDSFKYMDVDYGHVSLPSDSRCRMKQFFLLNICSTDSASEKIETFKDISLKTSDKQRGKKAVSMS